MTDLRQHISQLAISLFEFTERAVMTIAVSFIFPIGSWLILIQFMVFSEYLTARMVVKKSAEPEKAPTATRMFIEAGAYIVLLLQVKAILKMFDLDDKLIQWPCAIITGFLFKKTINNISQYTGIDLWKQFINAIEDLINKNK